MLSMHKCCDYSTWLDKLEDMEDQASRPRLNGSDGIASTCCWNALLRMGISLERIQNAQEMLDLRKSGKPPR